MRTTLDVLAAATVVVILAPILAPYARRVAGTTGATLPGAWGLFWRRVAPVVAGAVCGARVLEGTRDRGRRGDVLDDGTGRTGRTWTTGRGTDEGPTRGPRVLEGTGPRGPGRRDGTRDRDRDRDLEGTAGRVTRGPPAPRTDPTPTDH